MGAARCAERFGQALGEEGALVIAALVETRAVKRHGRHEVRMRASGVPVRLPDERAEVMSVGGTVAVFERVLDALKHAPLVEDPEGEGVVEGVAGVGEGVEARGEVGGVDPFEAVETAAAHRSAGRRCAAAEATRRRDQVEQAAPHGPRRRRHGGGHTPKHREAYHTVGWKMVKKEARPADSGARTPHAGENFVY